MAGAVFDPSFSDWSFGFRPGRSAHQAVEAARRHIAAGGEWVVDIELDRFFDRVGHDALMARVPAGSMTSGCCGWFVATWTRE